MRVAAPPGVRWPIVLVVGCCLAGYLYLVGSRVYRAAQSWNSLHRFAMQSLRTLVLSVLALLVAVVLDVLAVVLGGGIF